MYSTGYWAVETELRSHKPARDALSGGGRTELVTLVSLLGTSRANGQRRCVNTNNIVVFVADRANEQTESWGLLDTYFPPERYPRPKEFERGNGQGLMVYIRTPESIHPVSRVGPSPGIDQKSLRLSLPWSSRVPKSASRMRQNTEARPRKHDNNFAWNGNEREHLLRGRERASAWVHQALRFYGCIDAGSRKSPRGLREAGVRHVGSLDREGLTCRVAKASLDNRSPLGHRAGVIRLEHGIRYFFDPSRMQANLKTILWRESGRSPMPFPGGFSSASVFFEPPAQRDFITYATDLAFRWELRTSTKALPIAWTGREGYHTLAAHRRGKRGVERVPIPLQRGMGLRVGPWFFLLLSAIQMRWRTEDEGPVTVTGHCEHDTMLEGYDEDLPFLAGCCGVWVPNSQWQARSRSQADGAVRHQTRRDLFSPYHRHHQLLYHPPLSLFHHPPHFLTAPTPAMMGNYDQPDVIYRGYLIPHAKYNALMKKTYVLDEGLRKRAPKVKPSGTDPSGIPQAEYSAEESPLDAGPTHMMFLLGCFEYEGGRQQVEDPSHPDAEHLLETEHDRERRAKFMRFFGNRDLSGTPTVGIWKVAFQLTEGL
ncbi:hypothetical protein FA13DRAFT_1705149 [Coprinellus micaceus]|uniref:Uncharacterized protein n=1 Tax=Coprinellus micaceus TaxID=71717 RepID=A0A4Y7TVF9_COPMI|nr:hypothetical protein FA13DRAFT_1705149 [Coprinellus micaceus]